MMQNVGRSAAATSLSCALILGCTQLSNGDRPASEGDGTALSPADIDLTELEDDYWQIRSGMRDSGNAVAVDARGNFYVVGDTQGVLDGENFGEADGFLRKYDASGRVQWTRQVGSTGSDGISAVAVDGEGNVYIAGWLGGPYICGPVYGGWDAFFSKYDQDGSLQWSQVISSLSADFAQAIAIAPDGNVYVAGYTSGELVPGGKLGLNDAFLFKADKYGTEIWVRQFGKDYANAASSLALDADAHVYVGGWSLPDGFVRKFTPDGLEEWTEVLPEAMVWGVALDGSSFYASGSIQTDGDENTYSDEDVFIRKYAADRSITWTQQFGAPSFPQYNRGVALAPNGDIVLANWSYPDPANQVGLESFVLRYDSAGALLDVHRSQTPENDTATGITVDNAGNIYLVGNAQSSGSAFVQRIAPR